MSYVRLGMGAAPLSTTLESSVGTSLLTIAPFTGPAAPFVALGGAITDMLASFGVGSGCGQTCVLSSNFANQASAKLDQNMALYFKIAPPRPASAQSAAVANFDQIWQWLEQQCSNPQLGSAGQRCISDRQSGACIWKAAAPAYPGEPAEGACWNWFNAYRDPIANDPNVVPDAQWQELNGTSSSNPSTTNGTAASGSISPWLLLAVAAGLLVWGLS